MRSPGKSIWWSFTRPVAAVADVVRERRTGALKLSVEDQEDVVLAVENTIMGEAHV